MKKILSLSLTLIIFVVSVNLPIIPYTDAECHPAYESFMNYLPSCNLCSENVKTVTLSSAILYSGHSANLSVLATANYSFALNDPVCNSVHIVSLVLWRSNQTMITLWDNSSIPTSASNQIDFDMVHSTNNLLSEASVTSFDYYPTVHSGPALPILAGESYNYVITFDNGQQVGGNLIAQ